MAIVKLAKKRLRRAQSLYWEYSRPLFCQVLAPPDARRVLVLSPHIDDDVIGCGGGIRQHPHPGASVLSVYFPRRGGNPAAGGPSAARIHFARPGGFIRSGPP